MTGKLRDMLKTAITLFLICVVVSVSLGFTNSITKDKIVERAAIDEENAKKEVLPSADSFQPVEDIGAIIGENPELSIVKKVFAGVKDGSVAGYVFSVVTRGYGGDIAVTVGIDNTGVISGVKIGDNSETPGLGSKSAEEPFISQLTGFAPKAPLTVVKSGKKAPEEIDAISSATITSKAVVSAVQAAVDMAGELLDKEAGKQ